MKFSRAVDAVSSRGTTCSSTAWNPTSLSPLIASKAHYSQHTPMAGRGLHIPYCDRLSRPSASVGATLLVFPFHDVTAITQP